MQRHSFVRSLHPLSISRSPSHHSSLTLPCSLDLATIKGAGERWTKADSFGASHRIASHCIASHRTVIGLQHFARHSTLSRQVLPAALGFLTCVVPHALKLSQYRGCAQGRAGHQRRHRHGDDNTRNARQQPHSFGKELQQQKAQSVVSPVGSTYAGNLRGWCRAR